jgi:transcription elongation factor Elf1
MTEEDLAALEAAPADATFRDVRALVTEVRRLRLMLYTPYTCAECGAERDGSDRVRAPKHGQRAFCSDCRTKDRASKRAWATRHRAAVKAAS